MVTESSWSRVYGMGAMRKIKVFIICCCLLRRVGDGILETGDGRQRRYVLGFDILNTSPDPGGCLKHSCSHGSMMKHSCAR